VLLVEFARPDPAAVGWARRLRDDGVEVVHAGPLDTVEQILRTAEQEDPDAVGVLGAAPPEGLGNALGDVRLFTAETAAETLENLCGGRSHTAGTPSDRGR
jgi:methylmalonyl-CoA mutase C-terminal domain/subunit